MRFYSHDVHGSPIICGPYPQGEYVFAVRRDGARIALRYLGYLYFTQAQYIPGGRVVKICVKGLCKDRYITSCRPLGAGWYLKGLLIERDEPLRGVFVLIDFKGIPISRFSPVVAGG